MGYDCGLRSVVISRVGAAEITSTPKASDGYREIALLATLYHWFYPLFKRDNGIAIGVVKAA